MKMVGTGTYRLCPGRTSFSFDQANGFRGWISQERVVLYVDENMISGNHYPEKRKRVKSFCRNGESKREFPI